MTDPCPTRDQLACLIAESPEGVDLEAIERHVAGCGACQAVLEELTSADPGRTTDRGDRPTEHGSYLDRLEKAPPTWVAPEEAAEGDETRGIVEGEPTPDSWPTIPGYEILGELGRGGMGVIYLARQVRADRLVAIKMIQNSGRGRPENLIRFSIEGESLARLRHPHIVQVYEVGADDGQPFLSMEYVEGGSLAQAIARRPPTAHQAAALVETLARAVHAAHQAGIIHRDLKPANVLLAPSAERAAAGPDPWLGSPKITDFGLAKRLGSDSGLTHTGQVLGTPSYMAPEQASSGAQVGVPADVYALGAILYELMSGRPPFKGESSWQTMMQVVHEPVTPPSRHRAGLARDLETICLKCLEKAPEKRYASADALAEDLRRHLAGEPIAARPVGPATRLVMWCRRKPAMAGLAAALLLVVPAGFAGVTTQWVRAERNYLEARAHEQRAVENYRLARAAVDDTMTRISENRLFLEPGLQNLRKELLASALRYYREFFKSRGDDPSARVDLMHASARMGRITREIGSIEEAKAYFEKGLEATRTLAEAHPDDPDVMGGRAEILIDLSRAQFLSGQAEQARKTAGEAVAIDRALEAGRPADAGLRIGLARGLLEAGIQQVYGGDLAGAESSLKEASAVAEGLADPTARRTRASALSTLGDALARTPGRLDDAIANHRAAIDVRRAAARDDPGDFWAREDLAGALLHLGDFLVFLNRPARALEQVGEARDLLDAIVRDNPRLTDARYMRGLAHYVAGSCLLGVGQHDDALASYRHALDDIGRVARDHPTEGRYQSPGLAGIQLSIGETLRNRGDLPGALRAMLVARKIQEEAAVKNPGSLANQVNLAMVHRSIANVQAESGEASAAIESAGRALEILDRLRTKGAGNIMVLSELYQARLAMGAAQRKAGHPSDALAWYRRAEGDLSGLAGQDPSNVEYLSLLGVCRCRIAALERAAGRTAEAVRSWEQARAEIAKVPLDLPDRLVNLAIVRSLHVALIAGAGAEGDAKRREEGDAAIEALKRAVTLGFKNAALLEDDPEFEPIRSRGDFRELVRSLRGRTAPGPLTRNTYSSE